VTGIERQSGRGHHDRDEELRVAAHEIEDACSRARLHV
jgi:hypothetical protein